MGTSGFILKKRENVEIYQLIHEVKAAADRAGLLAPIEPKFHVDYVDGNKRECAFGNIANTFEEIPGKEDMPIDIYSDGYDKYDWLVEGGHLIHVVIFDFVWMCERVLLDFLFEYLKNNPEDYFWCEDEWYYTFDDIARIKERGFDPDWCYKDPHLEEDPLERIKENRNRVRSGFILKERESAGIYQMIHEVKKAAGRAQVRYSIGSEFRDSRNGRGVSVKGNIAKTFEGMSGTDDVKKEDTAISICSAEQYDDLYDWLIKGCDLVDVVTFDRVGHRERILLDFLYEYLKRNPEDYFWCRGYDWYYTFDDIARIKQKEFDPLWCYKDPRLKEDPH